MINFQRTNLQELIVHKVGNKSMEEGVVLTDAQLNEQELEEVAAQLMLFFLKPFKEAPASFFWHPAELGMNEVFQIVTKVFNEVKEFVTASKDLAKILYELSVHPRIKSGELYIAYFTDCEYNARIVDAIGIFKSEEKDPFLKIEYARDGKVQLQIEDGISLDKLDKGCLILNMDSDTGYIVFNLDNVSKNNEAQYWKDDFLRIRPLNDSFNTTKNFLSITKDFITAAMPGEFDVERTSQINFLNKSVDYFSDRETFNIQEFEKDVFENEEIIESFRRFGSSYLDKNDIEIADTFEISRQAVKKQARIFKSVLKLDRNFHVYVHGDTDLIEKGYDSHKGKHFYKIYFDEEA